MDVGPDPRGFSIPARECRTEGEWHEHGWALTGPQTGSILAVIGLACLMLKLVGG